jgi:short subunit dehydrogenase-like uncharacterized protein
MSERTWDLVLYGATGFTGQIAASTLLSHAPSDLRWAIAGRNRAKLDTLHGRLGDKVGVIVADSADHAAVDAMVASTVALISTAGPFAKYGTPVVESAVRHGTHYADITGETPWVRGLIDRFHDQAQQDGTRIVPLCGYDSVPSDMGAWMMADLIRERWGEPTAEVRAAFLAAGGGLNGGTLASAIEMGERGETRQVADTLLLNPSDCRTQEERRRSKDPRKVVYDEDLGRWLAPFIMGPVNSRVVRRSNALFSKEGRAYGPEFGYREWLDAGSRRRALAATGILGAATGLLASKTGRRIARALGPSPGQGPKEGAIAAGFIRTRYVARSASGKLAFGRMEYKGDAGNKATVLMLCTAGMLLAKEGATLPQRGGLLTPATAFEGRLLEQLRAAGMTWEAAPA